MYGKLTMTYLKYLVYLYGLEAITYMVHPKSNWKKWRKRERLKLEW